MTSRFNCSIGSRTRSANKKSPSVLEARPDCKTLTWKHNQMKPAQVRKTSNRKPASSQVRKTTEQPNGRLPFVRSFDDATIAIMLEEYAKMPKAGPIFASYCAGLYRDQREVLLDRLMASDALNSTDSSYLSQINHLHAGLLKSYRLMEDAEAEGHALRLSCVALTREFFLDTQPTQAAFYHVELGWTLLWDKIEASMKAGLEQFSNCKRQVYLLQQSAKAPGAIAQLAGQGTQPAEDPLDVGTTGRTAATK